MRFLLDESAELRLGDFLRQWGHDVTAIAQDYPSSLADRSVLELANREQRILITNDRDFGELVVRHRVPHRGIIYFRLGDQSIRAKALWLESILTSHLDDLSHLLVVTERGVRVRRTQER
ncbi:MAG TPA: DUF5615 family PIN-like protein [Chloroflexota bacterium]|nr:DUF5615 family PIN-like protein [Chloroflexota bacterium]